MNAMIDQRESDSDDDDSCPSYFLNAPRWAQIKQSSKLVQGFDNSNDSENHFMLYGHRESKFSERRRKSSSYGIDYFARFHWGPEFEKLMTSSDPNFIPNSTRVILGGVAIELGHLWSPTFDDAEGFSLPDTSGIKYAVQPDGARVPVAIFPNGLWGKYSDLQWDAFTHECNPDAILRTWIKEMDAWVKAHLLDQQKALADRRVSDIRESLRFDREGRTVTFPLLGALCTLSSAAAAVPANADRGGTSTAAISNVGADTPTESAPDSEKPAHEKAPEPAALDKRDRKRKQRSKQEGCHRRCISADDHLQHWSNKKEHLEQFDAFILHHAVMREHSSETGKALRERYQRWHEKMSPQAGGTSLSQRHFGYCCAARFCKTDSNNIALYHGIALRVASDREM